MTVVQLSSSAKAQMIHKPSIVTIWSFKKKSAAPGLAQWSNINKIKFNADKYKAYVFI